MEKSMLQYGEYYHIYNRGNNSETLFYSPENYSYFLELYAKYIVPIANTFAYCLMSNHFHFVVQIKTESEIKTFSELQLFENNKRNIITDRKPVPSHQFSHLFIAYSKAINKKRKRTGSLFEHPFERRIIENEMYLQNSIAYVHNNPVKAKLVKSVSEYRWSSYNALLTENKTKLDRDFVMKLFGDKQYFINFNDAFSGELEY